MSHFRMVLCLGLAIVVAVLVESSIVKAEEGLAKTSSAPNVLLVMADDLGFSDLGCYGGEIQTPNLDHLAAEGIRCTQFYNTGRCWPTRAALLTGFYAQSVRRDALPGIRSGGRGTRPAWAKLLPERLKSYGYRTYHSGKWHLDGSSAAAGFDHSYRLEDQGRFFNPKAHFKDDVRQEPIEPGSGFYGTIAIADHAIECLQEHSDLHADQPFFHYVAFTAPHFPLHALPQDIEKYQGVYRDGWNAVRDGRWARQQELNLISGTLSAVESEVGPPYHFPKALEVLGDGEVNRPLPWDSLNQVQRDFQEAKMRVHAAMVDRLDQEFGRILQQIKEMGAWDNTLILFLSDNGASAEIMVRDDGHDPTASPGSAATYLCLGPGWSTVGNTPFRRHKTWVHEGGIATPLIVHWPDKIRSPGTFSHQVSHVVDVVPTILNVARPAGSSLEPTVSDRPQFFGESQLEAWTTPTQVSQTRLLWWSHEGNQALRFGDWKLVRAKGEAWGLFDLSLDRTEMQNRIGDYPDWAASLEGAWNTIQQSCIEAATGDEAGPFPKTRDAVDREALRALQPSGR